MASRARIHSSPRRRRARQPRRDVPRCRNGLGEIGGFAAVSLQPAAGAHGELTGAADDAAYNADRGEPGRNQIPDPRLGPRHEPGLDHDGWIHCVDVPSDERGNIDLAALTAACNDQVAGLMITNPNTLGLFEEHLPEVVQRVHACGGLVYGDGANMNALTGIVRPGELGIDLLHYNLHKTFATPHGGGGPGCGARRSLGDPGSITCPGRSWHASPVHAARPRIM